MRRAIGLFVKKRAREHDRCKNDKVFDGRYGHKWVFVQYIHSNMDVLTEHHLVNSVFPSDIYLQ